MVAFEWGPENEVFLPHIDAEHRRVFRAAKQLYDAFTLSNVSEVKAQLSSLSQHFEDHFSTEEWLMKSTHYGLFGWHRAQHETLRRRLRLFRPQLEEGDSEAAELFWDFLSGWLHDHTSVTDRMLGAFIRNYERSHGLIMAESPHPEEAPVV